MGDLRLRFPDECERGFREFHFEQSLVFVRIALVLSIALNALSGILDMFLVIPVLEPLVPAPTLAPTS